MHFHNVSLSSQIRLKRGNSFRVSWKTKTSWGWYSSMSQRRFRKNSRKRSINDHIPMRLIGALFLFIWNQTYTDQTASPGHILDTYRSAIHKHVRVMNQTSLAFLIIHTRLLSWTITTSTWRAFEVIAISIVFRVQSIRAIRLMLTVQL